MRVNIGTPQSEAPAPSVASAAPAAAAGPTTAPAPAPPAEPAATAGASMENNTAFTVQALLQTVAAMQESIAQLTRQLNETRKFEVAGAPKMDLKDQKDPSTFAGQHFNSWSEEFVTHLTMRDRRWETLLSYIKEKSTTPLDELDGPALMKKADITSDNILQIFQAQLYVYLKRFTSGEPLSYVLANGKDGAFEAWRRMCDQGASRRDRSMRDERRAIWHPEGIKESQLIAGIEAWENRLAQYLKVKSDDSMTVTDKLMALEDMCPVPIQKHLAMLEAQGQISDSGPKAYSEHKAAIDQYFLDEKPWVRRAARYTLSARRPRRTQPRLQSLRLARRAPRRTGPRNLSSNSSPS